LQVTVVVVAVWLLCVALAVFLTLRVYLTSENLPSSRQ